ncbi:MAG: GyrI-like domain-containing protein [candidate division KSB1 bacterium]|nr:GyrI-like domain-containing protein [candidate division KSB1 bacterium]MDZ7302711.1 GyrI-like domain-containing protein [candidate division KSB1 bacterium]MDZ7311758.1 GyrI-like domain-containing protein [candidate division KSB1 bacterium]
MKKVTKIVIGIGAALVIVVVASVALFMYYMMQGPDLTKYEHLKNPKISTAPNQKMIVVEAKGEPNVAGKKAFGLLFQMYFKMKDTPKDFRQLAPRARWPVASDTPKTEWVGLYAMPVPETTTELPPYEAAPDLKVALTTWEYGEVAEILHLGPYDKEQPAIARLMEFVKAQGYEVIGAHEEEYLKGPTMFSKGDPEKYVTIIRYRVKKSDQM